jgi:hypothetical protein
MTDRVHEIEGLEFTDDSMIVTVDAEKHVFDLATVSARLLRASPEQRRDFVVSASGYGIRWPAVDEDLSVDALLAAECAPSSQPLEG